MLEGINHTCIAVHDLDRSVKFYRDVVGCKVGEELDYTSVICIPLRAGGDTLELMKVLDPKAKNIQQPMEPGDEGNVHICFQVDSIEEHAQKVKDSGAEVTSDVHEMTVGGGTVIFTFYFRDPDGYALQFLKVGK
jgi:catechol 2,3-dioxygenase-like lactoylglutathione lyase family enzyme|tara:strand:+ start:1985 stop:2389 length:405 start_codon:yes stop_codon:yes gene_type:complete